jgi:hypothetical protein
MFVGHLAAGVETTIYRSDVPLGVAAFGGPEGLLPLGVTQPGGRSPGPRIGSGHFLRRWASEWR